MEYINGEYLPTVGVLFGALALSQLLPHTAVLRHPVAVK
jgi:hypothetical protein